MAQHFRAGVVVVVRHPDGRQLLAFERSDSPDSWQLPQGGIDRDEAGGVRLRAAGTRRVGATGPRAVQGRLPALRIRRAEPALGEGPLEWLEHATGVLGIRRPADDGSSIVSVINLTDTTVRLPASWGTDLLVASSVDVAALSTDHAAADTSVLVLGSETAAWLRSQP